jgi:hypothetical protein
MLLQDTVKKLQITCKRLLVPELLLLAKAGGVNGVLVATVHTVNAVVIGITVGVGVGPLCTYNRQFSQTSACIGVESVRTEFFMTKNQPHKCL